MQIPKSFGWQFSIMLCFWIRQCLTVPSDMAGSNSTWQEIRHMGHLLVTVYLGKNLPIPKNKMETFKGKNGVFFFSFVNLILSALSHTTDHFIYLLMVYIRCFLSCKIPQLDFLTSQLAEYSFTTSVLL